MTNKTHLRRLLLFIMIVAIVPPALWGDPPSALNDRGGDSWRNFILDFQTLIGGGLAIFAAWWTVTAMENTDAEAQRRHDEIMKATLVRDEKALARARYFMLQKIELARSVCSKLTSEQVPQIRTKSPRGLTTIYSNSIAFVGWLLNAFDDEEWKQAVHLLDVKLIEEIMSVQAACRQFLLFAPEREERLSEGFSVSEERLQLVLDNTALLVVEKCNSFQSALNAWKTV